MVVTSYNPSFGEAETSGFLKLAGQPLWPTDDLQGTEGPCLRNQD